VSLAHVELLTNDFVLHISLGQAPLPLIQHEWRHRVGSGKCIGGYNDLRVSISYGSACLNSPMLACPIQRGRGFPPSSHAYADLA
jgi:hypothetical protein